MPDWNLPLLNRSRYCSMNISAGIFDCARTHCGVRMAYHAWFLGTGITYVSTFINTHILIPPAREFVHRIYQRTDPPQESPGMLRLWTASLEFCCCCCCCCCCRCCCYTTLFFYEHYSPPENSYVVYYSWSTIDIWCIVYIIYILLTPPVCKQTDI